MVVELKGGSSEPNEPPLDPPLNLLASRYMKTLGAFFFFNGWSDLRFHFYYECPHFNGWGVFCTWVWAFHMYTVANCTQLVIITGDLVKAYVYLSMIYYATVQKIFDSSSWYDVNFRWYCQIPSHNHVGKQLCDCSMAVSLMFICTPTSLAIFRCYMLD